MADSGHHLPRHRLLRLALPRHPLRRAQATDQGPRYQDREAIGSPCQGCEDSLLLFGVIIHLFFDYNSNISGEDEDGWSDPEKRSQGESDR